MTNLLTWSITILHISSVNGIASSFLHPAILHCSDSSDGKTASSLPVITVRPAAEPTPSWQKQTWRHRGTKQTGDRHGPQPPPACWAKTRNKADRLSDGGLEPFFTPPRQSKTGSSPVSESCQPWVNRDKNTYPDDRTTTDLPIEDITCTNGATQEAANHWH